MNKKDNTKKVGILQRFEKIEDNLNSNDNDDNGNRKVEIFQVIKDIKDKGIKINDNDEAIREIREHIQNLRNKGVRDNNFDEISKEIRDHIQNLKDEGIYVNINNDQVNDLVNKILKGISKKDSESESEDLDSEYLYSQNLESFFKKYKDKNIKTFYKNFDTILIRMKSIMILKIITMKQFLNMIFHKNTILLLITLMNLKRYKKKRIRAP